MQKKLTRLACDFCGISRSDWLLEEVLLGLGLGLGFLTQFRISGYIGASEVLILSATFLLFKKYNKNIFYFEKNFKGFVKLYLFVVLFVIAPVLSLSFSPFYPDAYDLRYIPSFMVGFMLCYLLVEGLKDGFDMRRTTLWFLGSFVILNIIFINFVPDSMTQSNGRYIGGAKNPNQLLFYASSLSLMLVVYSKKIGIIFFPVIFYIMLKTKSDAYFLTVFMTIFSYLFYKILYVKRFSFQLNLVSMFSVFCALMFFVIYEYSHELIELWDMAGGGPRIPLFINGVLASLNSPLFGHGVGRFSGIDGPYQYWEVHSTFFDFSIQFGFLFPILIYVVFFRFFFKMLIMRELLIASFVLGFIASSFFHFNGRHFTFWVELAIFYYYVFEYKGKRQIFDFQENLLSTFSMQKNRIEQNQAG